MDPTNLQTPEEMLERWGGVECQCDPSVGHLCECCHDIQVLRDLIKERDYLKGQHDKLRDCAQLLVIRMKEIGLDMDVRIRALYQMLDAAAE